MAIHFENIIIPAGVSLVSALLLFTIRYWIISLIRSWAGERKSRLDDMVIGSFRFPSIFWVVVIALYMGVAFSDFPTKYFHYLAKFTDVIIILSITIATANLLGKLLRNYVVVSNLPIPTTGLFYVIIKGAVYIAGFLIVLTLFGISIAPMLTALGIGGLAVALALQDTLANLFSGIHILLEKPVRIGDFVKLESGQEGYVEDITWRTARIRMLPNNTVIIPNKKLAESIVTNYYLPEKRMAFSIPVSVSYDADIDMVEGILLEEARRAAGAIPGFLKEPGPAVRFNPGFGNSSLDFTVVCHVGEYRDQITVQHELRKAIFKRFRKEGIEISYPHRTIYVREEKNNEYEEKT